MDISKILQLIGPDQLAPELQGEIEQLIAALIETPENAAALERILFLLGVQKLDPETQEKVSENIKSVVDMAAKDLLESLSGVEKERLKIKRAYLSKVNESDKSISEYAKQRPQKKEEYRWDSGYGTDTMKSDKSKPKVADFKWSKTGYSPLSGKQYGRQKSC